MSYTVENTTDELSYLVGAKIEKLKIVPDEYEPEATRLVLTVKVTGPPVEDQFGSVSDRVEVEVEVWQDAEGNGPGFLALTKVLAAKPRAKASAS